LEIYSEFLLREIIEEQLHDSLLQTGENWQLKTRPGKTGIENVDWHQIQLHHLREPCFVFTWLVAN